MIGELSGYWGEAAGREKTKKSKVKVLPDRYWRETYVFYGNNYEFWNCLEPTVVLAGPSEAGKTITGLCLLHWIALTNPNLRAVIVRKVRSSMYSTVLQSFQDKILPPGGVCIVGGEQIKVSPYGGAQPSWYDYSNGSKIYVSGMDDAGESSSGAQSNKVLGAEFDVIYVNQAEELSLHDIEKLETRVTGRAGNIKNRPPQLLMDCNPGGANHALKMKERLGHLKMISARHRDNPTLYEQFTGTLTEQGERTLDRLNRLTGVRKQRLLYGMWVGADGMFFEHFDPAVHGVSKFELHEGMSLWASMDYGFNHWNMTYFHAQDGDGNIFTFHEMAHRRMYPHQIAPEIHEALAGYGKSFGDLDCFLAGPDVFAQTGFSEQTICQKYQDCEITLTSGVAGPGSRKQKAHHFLSLLGDPKVEGSDPRWFYVKGKCPKLEECVPLMVPDPNNSEIYKKVDTDSNGVGGDDPIDALLIGLFRPHLSSMS